MGLCVTVFKGAYLCAGAEGLQHVKGAYISRHQLFCWRQLHSWRAQSQQSDYTWGMRRLWTQHVETAGGVSEAGGYRLLLPFFWSHHDIITWKLSIVITTLLHYYRNTQESYIWELSSHCFIVA